MNKTKGIEDLIKEIWNKFQLNSNQVNNLLANYLLKVGDNLFDILKLEEHEIKRMLWEWISYGYGSRINNENIDYFSKDNFDNKIEEIFMTDNEIKEKEKKEDEEFQKQKKFDVEKFINQFEDNNLKEFLNIFYIDDEYVFREMFYKMKKDEIEWLYDKYIKNIYQDMRKMQKWKLSNHIKNVLFEKRKEKLKDLCSCTKEELWKIIKRFPLILWYNLERKIEEFKKVWVKEEELWKIIKRFPQILWYNVERKIKDFIKIWIKEEELWKIIKRFPPVLRYNIENKKEWFKKVWIKEEELWKIIKRFPPVLWYNIENKKEWFDNIWIKEEELWKIIKRFPQILW